MLEELVKIREALQPKPSLPPPTKPEGFVNEFAAFSRSVASSASPSP